MLLHDLLLRCSVFTGISNFRRIVTQHGWDAVEAAHHAALRSKGTHMPAWSTTATAFRTIGSTDK